MDAIQEAVAETKFQERLKRLSELPIRKKKELWDAIKSRELMFGDIARIFGVEGDEECVKQIIPQR